MRLAWILCLAAIPLFGQQDFYRFSVDQDRLSGAPDFSSLNHPIGPGDRIVVRDGHFYREGGDRARVRFFGVSLAFGANFPEQQDAARIAKRLRRLGINIVRLHHMDSNPDADPARADSTLTTGPYPTLNPVSIARLRNFLDALKAEGIYADLNVHVGYLFRPAVDQVPALPGMDMPKQSKPLHIFYPRMIELQQEYARKLIDALKLKGDPVLAIVEIDNETSMVQAWMRGLLDRYAVGDYKTELQKQWNAYTGQDIPLVGFKDTANPHLDQWLEFLADRDRYYLDRMRRAIRASADNFVPLTGTQMGYGGLLNLDSQADMDFQDNHFYIDHYNFPHRQWDAHDWRIRDASSVGTGLSSFLNMAAARVMGMPYTVSEFNQPWPNRQGAEIDPTLAAFAAFQDWDGLMHFAYAHARDWANTVPDNFNVNGDWTKFVNFGQAAALFREAAIDPAKSALAIPVDRAMELRFGRVKDPGGVATFLATAGIDPGMALLHRIGLRKVEGAAAPVAATRDLVYELAYDPKARLLVLQGDKAAGVFGYAGTKKISAGPIDVQLAPSARGFATILLTALDRKPIADSAHLLLTTPGYTLGTVPGTDPPRRQQFILYPGTKDWWTLEPEPRYSDRPSGDRSAGVQPVWMERVESTVTLHSSAKRMTVYPLDGAGSRLVSFAAQPVAGGLEIHLQADGQQFAPWYELVR